MATKQEIIEIQQNLKNLGFDPGPIDGIVGTKTRSAAQNYINSLSGTAAKATYDYYNNVLGGLTSKKIITSKEEPKKDKFILYDKNGNSYEYDVFPQAQVDGGILFEEIPTLEQDGTEDKTIEGGKTFNELLEGIEFGPSISADATSYEVDKINAELGLSGSAFGSALSRAENRIEQGLYTEDEYNALVKELQQDLEVLLI